jgi:hypothetical protein
MPEMQMMAALKMVAEMRATGVTATVAALRAAGGRVARSRERGSGQRNRGNGGNEERARSGHGFAETKTNGEGRGLETKRPVRARYVRTGPSSRSA